MDCTLLMPAGKVTAQICRRMGETCRTLLRSGKSFEALCLVEPNDDCRSLLAKLATEHPTVRCLEFDPAAGLSAALAAGLAAARGEIVVTWEPSGHYPFHQWLSLVNRLARADMACGRRRRSRIGRVALSALHLPRRLLLGLDARDPDCMFWAARREAVADLQLTPGMHRFLGSIVSARGYRVAEVEVEHLPKMLSPRYVDDGASFGNLMTVWKQRRQASRRRARTLAIDSDSPNFRKAA